MWEKDHEEIISLFKTAKNPTEVFGENPKRARILYRQYCKLMHPDSHDSADSSKATVAFQMLQALWEKYESALNGAKEGVDSVQNTIYINKRQYLISFLLTESSDIKVFILKDGTKQVIFPISKKGTAIEISNLEKFVKNASNYPGCEHFFTKPQTKLFQVPQKDGNHGAVLLDIPAELAGAMTEGRSLAWVATNHEGQIHPKDVAWVWRRLVSVAAICSDEGVDYKFDPTLDLIFPEKHHILPLSYLCPKKSATLLKHPIQNAASLMQKLMLPGPSSHYINQYFNAIELDNASYKNYGQLLKDFDWVIEREWGRRKFHPFAFPEGWK